MKYVIHFLFFCYSYSYVTDGPFLSNKKFILHRRHNLKDLENNAKEIETPFLANKINSPNKKIEKLGPLIMRRQDSDTGETSSDADKFEFKDEYKKTWAHMQYQVLNQSVPGGDKVYMLAARPWGVPCGDPNQHDMPWGTCMLPMECDSEFRIYRGDYFCGRTDFVCCGLLDNTYDLNAPFDVSFASDSFASDSSEARNRPTAHKKKSKQSNEHNKRREDRNKRKKSMRDLIDKIIKEIRSLLNKASRNSSRIKQKKAKQLKLFLKDLKLQYKKDRQAVLDTQSVLTIRIDLALRNKLEELRQTNHNFMKNETFRHIIVTGAHTMTRSEAMMLMQAYPELQEYLIKRRDNGKTVEIDPLGYDIEYGLMYY